MEPPLDSSTRAVAVRMKAAWPPERSPTSLKFSSKTVGGGGSVARATRRREQRERSVRVSVFIRSLVSGADRAVDAALPRSADLKSAVSPTCSRRGGLLDKRGRIGNRLGIGSRPAECNSAIQQSA